MTAVWRTTWKSLRALFLLLVVMLLPIGVNALNRGMSDIAWHQATRNPTGQAPAAAEEARAVIQVYAAPAFNWRGYFGVHPWIAVKREGADRWQRWEVTGWSGGRVVHDRMAPDAEWFGSRPTLLVDLRGGAEVEALIDRVEQAVETYPYDGRYEIFPGPNSNTFVAHVGRAVPELGLDLPANALGKNWLPWDAPLARAPSGGGMLLSAGGWAALLVAPEEGVEVTLLGLSLGLDLAPLDLRLPGVGGLRCGTLTPGCGPGPSG